MGVVTAKTSNRPYTLRVECTVNDQTSAGTRYKAKISLVSDSGWGTFEYGVKVSLAVHNQQILNSAVYDAIFGSGDYAGKTIVFWEGLTARFPHDSNGNLKAGFRGDFMSSQFGNAATPWGEESAPRIAFAAPGQCKDVVVTSPSAGTFVTDWKANGGVIEGYDLRYSTNSSMSGATTVTDVSAFHQVTGASQDTTYYVQTRAKNRDAVGAWSASGSVRVKAAAPGTPNPTLSSPSAGQLKATWSAPSGVVSGYDLRFSTSSIMSSPTQVNDVSSGYTRTGLSQDTTYYVQVRAKNADATGTWSAAESVRVTAAAPAAPATPTVSSPAVGQFAATWTKPAGIVDTYDLRFSTSSSMTSPTQIDGVSSGYVRSSLTQNDYYYVQVRARNKDGVSAWSTARSVRIMAATPAAPAAPGLTSPAPGQLKATWSAPSGVVTGYDARYSTSSSMTGATQVDNVTSGVTWSNLAQDTTYYVQVRAKNLDGTSGWSATSLVRVVADTPTVPATPAVSSPGAGMFLATWAASSGLVSGYDLQYSTSSSMSSPVQVNGVTSPYTRAGLTPGGTYYVQVRAKNTDGASAWSTARSVVLNATVPSTLAAPSVGAGSSTGSVALSWDAPSDTGGKPITSYEVWLSLTSTFADGSNVYSGTGRSTTVASLSPGQSVWVWVRSSNANATSAWSPAGTGEARAEAPSVPQTVALDATPAGVTTLTWVAPSSTGGKSITGYDVQYSTSSAFTGASTVSASSPHAQSGRAPGSRWYARVRAKNEDAVSAWVTVDVLVPSGGEYDSGSAWEVAIVEYDDGTAWVSATVEYDNGTGWVPVGT